VSSSVDPHEVPVTVEDLIDAWLSGPPSGPVGRDTWLCALIAALRETGPVVWRAFLITLHTDGTPCFSRQRAVEEFARVRRARWRWARKAARYDVRLVPNDRTLAERWGIRTARDAIVYRDGRA
jgi:hypothetical protein